MTIKINKNPNIGIKIFTILPIPFFTPAETIKKVKIDEERIKKEISEKKLQTEYFLYEILFSLDDGEKLEEKFSIEDKEKLN